MARGSRRIAADLADARAPEQLCAEIESRGIAIDILINNAGYGVTGHYPAQPWTTHADFLQVLVTAPCHLAWLLLPGMQQRGYGRIANIASLAGLMPGSAGHTLYAASKAFMIKFSQSLALENTSRGVNVCAVCPGFTYSEFHDVTGTRGIVSKMPKWMWLSAEEVAHIGVDALERGEIVCVTGRANRAIKVADETAARPFRAAHDAEALEEFSQAGRLNPDRPALSNQQGRIEWLKST